MATLSRRVGVLVEVFEDSNLARAAMQELRSVGFSDSEIEVAYVDRRLLDEGEPESPLGVASTRAAAGLGLGALWGVGMLAGVVPAISSQSINPMMTAGTLGLLLCSAAAAVAVGGVGALIDLRGSHAKFKSPESAPGLAVLTVKAGPREAVASSVLSRFDASERSSIQAT